MNMRFKVFSGAVGGVFIFAGVILVLVPHEIKKIGLTKEIFVDQFATTSGSDGKNGYVAVTVNTNVTYPKEVSLGNTILVELQE